MCKTTSITLLENALGRKEEDRLSEVEEESPCRWTLMIVKGVIEEHIQVDAQQKNIIPNMISETASNFRNVIPLTDSLEPSPYRSLDGQRLLLAGRLQPVRHCSRWSEFQRCEVWHVVLKLVR